jgi:hypothetical protein
VILFACSSNTGTQLPKADFFVNPQQQFALRVGETAGVLTTSAIVLVRFNGVTEDSRCPVDVQCITAGFAAALLTVQTTYNIHDITLNVPPSGTVSEVVDEVTVVSFGVRPEAQEGVTIDPLTYVVGLSVLETGSPQ